MTYSVHNPLISARDLANARTELLSKNPSAIDLGISKAWAARAIAAYDLAVEELSLTRFADAVGFHNEAIEHASNVSPTFLANIVSTLAQSQENAIEALKYEP